MSSARQLQRKIKRKVRPSGILMSREPIYIFTAVCNKIKWLYAIMIWIPIADLIEIHGCDYFDTVDLTGSKRFSNGSYLYERVLIPPYLTGEYDYEIIFDGHRINVPQHVRGCVCQMKACIRFCCHPQHLLVFNKRECTSVQPETISYSPYVNITLDHHKVVQKNITAEFVAQHGLPIPCAIHYALHPEQDVADNWSLFENGTLLRHYDRNYMSKMDYCLQPEKFDGHYKLTVHNCGIAVAEKWDKIMCRYVMICSIICIILTIFVYVLLPKLQKLHGKCFICYLLSLGVGCTALIIDQVGDWEYCLTTGYVGYFAIMAAFLWLAIMSFDLWNTFRGTIRHMTKAPFFLSYNIIAWSTALVLLAIVYAMDFIATEDTPLLWIPGVGYYSCWIKTEDWPAMIYFYGPMMLLIIFNVSMFIPTAVRIYKTQKEFQNIVGQARHRKMVNEWQTFSLFLRLFVIMGVTWIFEICSYLSSNHSTLRKFFIVADLLNSAQGILIFGLFVLKPSVWKLLLNRCSRPSLPYYWELRKLQSDTS
ncbi:G-protein coupled receptor Mth-like isoform X2 [Scaptodrosophila lebanonensis]|uniref:G-protein coupled receptor Mth-like isoform X2 n=1 Tax=Drosophila lebanonensis TaxID=7225 RepID=A0A6J2TYD3_DROLE|nr:G-protein coupled receptor Mth-like isoform X2 [Scaptodrosophila lebanonensis]